jgi:histidyl-tRNA synthetase
VILVNNRRLMDIQLQAAGIANEQKPGVLHWIDRREKLSSTDWELYGEEIGLSPSQITAMKATLENQDLWQQSEALVGMFAAARSLGISPYLRFDPGIVRGLDYYTDTVFEAQEVRGDIRRAILGGGRYDNLVADVGGEPLPGIGFAMGDVVISLVLEAKGLIPANVGEYPAQVLVTVFDQERQPASLAFTSRLRQAGINTNLYPETAKLPKQLKYADRLGVRLAVVIGPDEAAQGFVTIKNLSDSSQVTLPAEQAPAVILSMLSL